MKKLTVWVLNLTILSTLSFAQGKDEKKWKVEDDHEPITTANFTVDEGTWMSLDVSPDGKSIVFDLLGDIYSLPISGGEATLLAGGISYEVQPRFSPDGKKIAFSSDRDGGDNIWIMNSDGSDAKALTKESDRLLNNPVWTPDGQYIIARKHYRNTRSLGAGEMWMYHVGGGAAGMQITKRRNWQHSSGEPWVSPDGHWVYFSEDIRPGQTWEYNGNPNTAIYVIKRIHLVNGDIETVASGIGSSVRPQVSPDGKTLAFVRRVRENTVLFLQDLATGKEWPLFDGLSKDAQETWAIHGIYPNFNWTPDGKNIVFYAKGKLAKIEVSSKKVSPIPFSAKVSQKLTDAVLFPQAVAPDQFDVKMIKQLAVAPDQKTIAFQALGYIYVRNMSNGKVSRVSSDQDVFEFYPNFSPDGNSIVYTTWNDQKFGTVRTIKLNGKDKKEIVSQPGHYIRPSFSADGKTVVYQRIGGDGLRNPIHSRETGIYIVSANGGQSQRVVKSGSNPQFNKNGNRLFVTGFEDGKVALLSYDLTGNDKLVHFTTENGNQLMVSPDEQWIAYNERYNVYIAPFLKTGQPIHLSPTTTAHPFKKVSSNTGDYITWSKNSKSLHWLLGPELFTRSVEETFEWLGGKKESLKSKPDSAGVFIGWKEKTHVPEGIIAFTGARIITMKGDEVIENGTMIVNNNKIEAIGSSTSIAIPKNAKVIDVKGKTIMPGMVDVHAHMGHGSSGMTPQNNWQQLANLAFGVTTTHDPSNSTEMVFSASELQKAGLITAPRIYSTGTILYGAEGSFKAIVNSFEDAKKHMERLKAVGAFSVKSYNQPRRDQRQMFIKAARELEMMVYPEGGSMLFANLSQVVDGHTGIEHSIPVSPLYKDVLTMWSHSKTAYTPTLIVSYGGQWGEEYWYAKTNVWENERLLNHVPREIVDSRSRRRTLAPDTEYNHIDNAKATADLVRNGVKVQLGAHGQLQGLGAHWELWMFVQGGMTPLEAIRCATLFGAEYIGMEKEIGSLEVGKLADFVVMDKNPLENIQNSQEISYVMINGRLLDTKTMDEVGHQPKKRPTLYFKESGFPGLGSAEAYGVEHSED